MKAPDDEPPTRPGAQEVIADCLKTYKMCLETAAYGLGEGGALAEASLISLLNDCADVNLAMANFLTRGSRFGPELAAFCIAVSEACAEAMEPMEHADGQLRAAYAACLRSRRSCAEWIGVLPRATPDVCDDILAATFPASDPPPTPTQI